MKAKIAVYSTFAVVLSNTCKYTQLCEMCLSYHLTVKIFHFSK